MNTIKSDIQGRHIHSPFVYRLVANVIFAPYPFYFFEEIDKMKPGKIGSDGLKITFRLVNFFGFEEIWFVGFNDANLEETCIKAKAGLTINHSDDIPQAQPENGQAGYKRLVLFDKSDKIDLCGKFPGNPEIWFVFCGKDTRPGEFFKKFDGNNKVNITFELNNLVIAIFNHIFEKQGYVIKH
jgi:hypothetical protein